MAGATGFEPATSAVTGQRSNQLSYAPVKGSEKVGDPSDLRQRLIEQIRPDATSPFRGPHQNSSPSWKKRFNSASADSTESDA